MPFVDLKKGQITYNKMAQDYAPRQMFQGNWKCAECGKEITQLPFQPDENRINQLKCRDCHQKSRNSFGGGGGGRFGNR